MHLQIVLHGEDNLQLHQLLDIPFAGYVTTGHTAKWSLNTTIEI